MKSIQKITILVIIFCFSFLGIIMQNIPVSASGIDVMTFLSQFTASNGRVTVKSDEIVYQIGGKNSALKSQLIDKPKGHPLSARLQYRNTIRIRIKNDSEASKLAIYFTTSSDITPSEEKKEIFSITPNSEYITYFFNLSTNAKASGYLRSLTFMPVDASSGSISVNLISFEYEPTHYEYAGKVQSCISNGETVTVKGTLNENYAGMTVRLLRTDVSNFKESINGLVSIGETRAEGTSYEIVFPHYNDEITNLSSQFFAVVDNVKVDKMFRIENYYDFSENPYKFILNNHEVNVSEYGAKGDSYTDDTDSIQSAIDVVSNLGGGTVILNGDKTPQGKRYIVTCIRMKSNVELRIEEGAVLWQSTRQSDYKYNVVYGHDVPLAGAYWTHAALCANYPLIYAYGIENIKITGGGTIRMDDTGAENNNTSNPEDLSVGCAYRIHLIPIGMYKTVNAEIKDVTIIRSNAYHIAAYGVTNLYIGNVVLKDVTCVGGDGISIGAGSKNVMLDSCHMYVTDDAIVLWSTSVVEPRDFWWENVAGEDYSVRNVKIVSSYITGGHGITFVPWGTDAQDLSLQEISDIYITDNVLANGNTAIAGWFDNPYYGASRATNGYLGELFDYSPIKNLYIKNNSVFGYATLNSVIATNVNSDCGMVGVSNFSNANFTRSSCQQYFESDWVSGLSYWSYEHNQSKQSVITEIVSNNYVGKLTNLNQGYTNLYQGLYLKRGEYSFDATVMIDNNADANMFVKDSENGNYIATIKITSTSMTQRTKLSFTVNKTGIYYVGIESFGITGGNVYIDNANIVTVIAESYDTIFSENFESDINAIFDGSDWNVKSSDGNKIFESSETSKISLLKLGMNDLYKSFDLKTDITIKKISNDFNAGFSVKFMQNNSSCYSVGYNVIQKKLSISRYNLSSESTLAAVYGLELEKNKMYSLLIKVFNGNIYAYIDDELVIYAIDKSSAVLTSGKIFLSSFGGVTAIDNFNIKPYDTYKMPVENIYDDYFNQDFENEKKYFDGYNWKIITQNDNNNAIIFGVYTPVSHLNLPGSYGDMDMQYSFFINEKSITSSNLMQLRFCIKGNSYYIAEFNDNLFNFIFYENGNRNVINSLNVSAIQTNKWHNIGMRVNYGTVKFFIDEVLILSAEDERQQLFDGGTIELYSQNYQMIYDNINVGYLKSLELEKTKEALIQPETNDKNQALLYVAIGVSLMVVGIIVFIFIKKKKTSKNKSY